MSAAVHDVTEATFAADVLAASKRRPIVVDFWAPWCGPCRTLGPLLEKLAAKADGAWSLAKVNSDESPALVREYGIQGIPAVKVFVEGKVAGEFVGALPRLEVESFLRTVVAVAGDAIALREAREHLERGDAAAARTRLAAISPDSAHADDAALLGRMLARASDVQGDGAPGGNAGAAGAAGAAHPAAGVAAGVAEGAGGSDARNDARALFDRASSRLAGGDFAAAASHLLEIVRADRAFENDLGRRALLALFTLLGHEHELTREGRGKLAALLF